MEKKRKKTSPKDVNQLAKHIVDQTTMDIMDVLAQNTMDNEKAIPEKNPAAVALGRLGGLKGGKARAAKLSAKKRKEIAKKAAEARWQRKKS